MIKKILVTILLSLALILSFLSITYSNLFTKKDITNNLDEINYYEITYNNIKKLLKNNLPNDELEYIYENYVTIEQVKSDVLLLLNIYENKNYDYKEIKTKFYNNILNELDDYDVTSSNVTTLASSLASTYANNIFPINQLKTINNKLPLKENITTISILIIVITVVSSLILIVLKKMTCLYNSLLIVGIIFILPKLFILLKPFLDNLYFYNQSFSLFLKEYAITIINNYFTMGITLLLGFLVCIIVKFIRHTNIDLNK